MSIIKYKISLNKYIYICLDIYNIIKKENNKISVGIFWDKTKHLLSQDELYYYFENNITLENIVDIIDNHIIIDIYYEHISSIFINSINYLYHNNIKYHRYFHSITYFWLLFLSGSIHLYQYRIHSYIHEKDSYIYYNNKYNYICEHYKTILSLIKNFGKLNKNDNEEDIDVYPSYPTKLIINKVRTFLQI